MKNNKSHIADKERKTKQRGFAGKKAALIAALIVLSIAVTSCGGSDSGGGQPGGGGNTPPVTSKPKQSEADKRAALDDGIGDVDFGGKTITILTTNDFSGVNAVSDIAAEKENGAVINDLVYKRNNQAAERMNVKFSFKKAAPGEAFVKAISDSINADEPAFDLILGPTNDLTASAMVGELVDLKSLDGIDLAKPWWAKKANDAMTVGGKLYTAAGDISTTMWYDMFVIYYNDDIISANSLKSPIQLVDGDAWTFDRFAELSMQGGSSYYGTAAAPNVFPSALAAVLGMPAAPSKDGYPSLDFDTKKTQTVAAKLPQMYSSKQSLVIEGDFTPSYKTNSDNLSPEFMEGKALFMTGYLSDLVLNNISENVNFSLGIIPMPRYDERQNSYLSTAYKTFSTVAIPTNAADTGMSAVAAEVLAVGGYKEVVIQGIYQIAQVRNSNPPNNEDVAGMLDIMRENFTVDFTAIHNLDIAGLFDKAALAEIDDFSAEYNANKADYSAALKAVIDAYKAIE